MKLKFAHKVRRAAAFTLIELMVVVAIIASLAAVSWGPILDKMNEGNRTAAVSNMRNIYTSLMDFNNSYGSFPCDSTAQDIEDQKGEEATQFGPIKGNYSNDYLRQIFFLNSVKPGLEDNFFAEIAIADGRQSQKPDKKVAGGKALSKGECGFGYVMRTDPDNAEVRTPVTGSDSIPILLSSVASKAPTKATDTRYDMNSFRGKLLYYTVTNSGKQGDLKEEKDDSEYGTMEGLFGEDKKGRDISNKYIVMPPNL